MRKIVVITVFSLMFLTVKAQVGLVIKTKEQSCFLVKDAAYTITVVGGVATTLLIEGISTPIVNNTYTKTGISVINSVVKIGIEVTGTVGTSATAFNVIDTVRLYPKSPLTTMFQITNANCIIGSTTGGAEVLVSGGTPPYFYSWSNGFKNRNNANIAAGTYYVSIRDINGCKVTKDTTAIVGNDPPIRTQIKPFNPSCYGLSDGSIDLFVTGGTGRYSYSWNNTQTTQNISGLDTGIYSVTITDNRGCTGTASVSLKQPSPLKVSFVQTPGETGTTVTANANGGTAPYIYKWGSVPGNPVITNLAIGNYTFSLLDAHGCAIADTVVNVPKKLTGGGGTGGGTDTTIIIRQTVSGTGKDFPIYSTFTPNGDGINDVWNIQEIQFDTASRYVDCTVKIFSQWNELVFESVGYTAPWNGTDKTNKALPAATYYYVIFTGSIDNKTYTGSVTIMY